MIRIIYLKNRILICSAILFIMWFCNIVILNSCTVDGTKNNNNENKNKDLKTLMLEPRAYVKWFQDEENGLNKIRTIDDIKFSLQYKPAEYVICMEEQQDNLSSDLIKQKKEFLTGMEYFDLTIALAEGNGDILKHNLMSTDKYDERVKYFAFDMQHNIMLIAENDTIPCGLYHFERTYNLAPYSKFLLGFEIENLTNINEWTIVFTDNIFNKGEIKFIYTNEEINNIPKLKTNDEI